MGDYNNFYSEMTQIMDISAIVHNEQSRLEQKSANIKNALDSQNRLIHLNQSYSSRMREYAYMIMIIALTVLIVVFIMVFQNFLPTIVYNLLIFIVSVLGFGWALFIYVGIQNRDNVDFDKIYSVSPDNALDSSGNAIANSINSGNISKTLGLAVNTTCIGNDCCNGGTIYSSADNKCVPKNAFTSIEQAYNNGEFSGNINKEFPNLNSSLLFSSYP